ALRYSHRGAKARVSLQWECSAPQETTATIGCRLPGALTWGRRGRMWCKPWILCGALGLALVAACGGGDDEAQSPQEALIVVSPHPDDESIFGAATIHRMAADPRRFVRAVYVSGGDRATVPGDCNGIPEARKTEMIVALRENETRAAWKVMVPDRDVPI